MPGPEALADARVSSGGVMLSKLPLTPWEAVAKVSAVLVSMGHPRFSCSQHHSFFMAGQAQPSGASLQSKGGKQPASLCWQHQCFFSSDHSTSKLSRPSWQSKASLPGLATPVASSATRASSMASAGSVRQPTPSCSQHQSCLSSDHTASQFAAAAWQSKSSGALEHPSCSCLQHQSFLSLGHTPDALAKPAWQSKRAAPALTVWLVLAAGALPPGSAAEDGAAPGGACACETATLLLAPTESGKASAEYTSAWSPVVFCSRRSAAAGYHREGGPVT
mmetsp:Transcript_106487/g.343581  ORF Transcript_106487/g.343581 Transcript_106487/m.343581 type:complete len:277 (+) Transcript_106487:220-1050(+)